MKKKREIDSLSFILITTMLFCIGLAFYFPSYALIRPVFAVEGNVEGLKTKVGKMPIPIDLVVNTKDGTSKLYYIPMSLMYGLKPNENSKMSVLTKPEWKFNSKTYEFEIDISINNIIEMEIDPSQRMADINRYDNKKVFN